ncbi:MAG: YraN family protein [Hyphomicrobiaceae bacterium]|nr:YraN family protein [Hyphomicrobiaceae bacterium]
MNRSARRDAERRGHWAEALAAWLLRVKGYRILDRRFRCHAGEIDLVARRGRHVAFVEVKMRDDLETAAASVTRRQQSRIAHAAEQWLAMKARDRDYDVSFDVVLVSPRSWPRHIASAFRV